MPNTYSNYLNLSAPAQSTIKGANRFQQDLLRLKTGALPSAASFTKKFDTKLSTPSFTPDWQKNLKLSTTPVGAPKTGFLKGIFGKGATGGPSPMGMISDVGGQILGTVGKPLGHVSGTSQALDVASSVLGSIPSPYTQAAALALKGVTALDRLLGKKAKAQVTAGETARGYDLAFSPQAGTRYGGLFGGKKRRQADVLSRRQDIANIKKIAAAGVAERRQQAAITGTQDVLAKSRQQLAGGLDTRLLSAKKGAKISSLKAIIRKLEAKVPEKKKIEVEEIKVNVIPDGALHARKHNLDVEGSTDKGIPVVSFEEGGEVTQHAEIERDEIIFHKEVTNKLEKLFKKSEEGDKDAALEAGKLLTSEILENTEDNTNLIQTV